MSAVYVSFARPLPSIVTQHGIMSMLRKSKNLFRKKYTTRMEGVQLLYPSAVLCRAAMRCKNLLVLLHYCFLSNLNTCAAEGCRTREL